MDVLSVRRWMDIFILLSKKKKKGINTKTQNQLKTIPTNYAMLVGINDGSAVEEHPEDVLLVVVQ